MKKQFNNNELEGYKGFIVVSCLTNNAIGRIEDNKIFLIYDIVHNAYIEFKYKRLTYALNILRKNNNILLLLSTFCHELEHIIMLNKYPNICNIVIEATEPNIQHITVLYVIESVLHANPKIKEGNSISCSYIAEFENNNWIFTDNDFEDFYYMLIRALSYYIGRIISVYGEKGYKRLLNIKNIKVRRLAQDCFKETVKLITNGILLDDYTVLLGIELIFSRHKNKFTC